MCCYIHHANWKYFIVYSMRGHSCLEKKIVGHFSRTHVKYAAKAGSEALLLTVLFCIKRKKKKKKQGGVVCWISGLAPACQNNQDGQSLDSPRPSSRSNVLDATLPHHLSSTLGESRRSIGKTPHDYQETGLSPNHKVGRPPLRERSIQFLVSILAKFERPLRWGLYACPRWMLLALWPGLESTQTLGACLHIKHQVGICIQQAHQYSPPYRHTTILQGQSGKTGSCCHKTSTSRKCYSQGRKTKTEKCCDSEHLNPAKLTFKWKQLSPGLIFFWLERLLKKLLFCLVVL